jgi:hypothetical protein
MRLLILSLAIAILMAGLMVGVRMAGGLTRTAAAEVLDVAQCDQPCWQGIRLGETTIDQVTDQFKANNLLRLNTISSKFDNERCWNSTLNNQTQAWEACAVFWYGSGRRIYLIRLNPPQGALTLGDAVAVFGHPTAVKLCWWDGKIPNMPTYFVRARIAFANGIEVWAYNLRRPLAEQINPQMLIYTVRYQSEMDNSPYRGDVRWPGFTRFGSRKMC